MIWKRVLAFIGLILILSMYAIALVSAFSHSPESRNWLIAAIYCTVIVPVFLYALQLVYRILKPEKDEIEP